MDIHKIDGSWSMASGYYLKLQQFEGPLDLLLHLIKVNEIDIFNIDIFLLTSQYLNYLRTLKYEDLADASEFLEMAATLIEIKTKMLLPGQEKSEDEEQDDEDPRQNLQERLIAYEQFKRVAEFLLDQPRFGDQIRTNHEWQRLEPMFEDCEAPLEGDPASLVILYEQMLTKLAERKPPAKVEVKTQLVTVEQKIDELAKLLETVKFALFQGFYKKFKSRYELVVYILATLELSKGGRLKLYQHEANGPLWLYRSDFDASKLPIAQEQEQEQDKVADDVSEAGQ
jgi:segregation and condensation protein A